MAQPDYTLGNGLNVAISYVPRPPQWEVGVRQFFQSKLFERKPNIRRHRQLARHTSQRGLRYCVRVWISAPVSEQPQPAGLDKQYFQSTAARLLVRPLRQPFVADPIAEAESPYQRDGESCDQPTEYHRTPKAIRFTPTMCGWQHDQRQLSPLHLRRGRKYLTVDGGGSGSGNGQLCHGDESPECWVQDSPARPLNTYMTMRAGVHPPASSQAMRARKAGFTGMASRSPIAPATAPPTLEHQDYLGTERMRTNYTGAVASTHSSLPWGDELPQPV